MTVGTLVITNSARELPGLIREAWRTVITMVREMHGSSWPTLDDLPPTASELREALDALAELTQMPLQDVCAQVGTAWAVLNPYPTPTFASEEAEETAWQLFFMLIAYGRDGHFLRAKFCAQLLEREIHIQAGKRTADWWFMRGQAYSWLPLPSGTRV